jgi:hypothetical protein
MSWLDVFNLISSLVSIILGLVSIGVAGVAIWFAFYVYDKGRTTDQSITNSLSKIEAQADALQKLTTKWMDRLTRYVTTDRPPGPLDESLSGLITALTQLPEAITAITLKISQPQTNAPPEHLIDGVIYGYIAMYYYTALTNFWAQANLPDASTFDPNSEFHQLMRRSIDGSCQDFRHIEQLLGQLDRQRLERNSAYPKYLETRDMWHQFVRSFADALVQRNK